MSSGFIYVVACVRMSSFHADWSSLYINPYILKHTALTSVHWLTLGLIPHLAVTNKVAMNMATQRLFQGCFPVFCISPTVKWWMTGNPIINLLRSQHSVNHSRPPFLFLQKAHKICSLLSHYWLFLLCVYVWCLHAWGNVCARIPCMWVWRPEVDIWCHFQTYEGHYTQVFMWVLVFQTHAFVTRTRSLLPEPSPYPLKE